MSEQKPRHPGLNLDERHGHAHDAAQVEVFGFWVFMMSDAIVFGLLFATYVVMEGALAGGPGPKDLFEIRPVFIETMLLLTSSLTFGMASLAMKHEKGTGRMLIWLGITLLLGLAFLGMELRDFAKMLDKGGSPDRSGFLSAYWSLVPLHGLHVATASLWMVMLIGQMVVHGVDRQVKTGLLRLGVLWHFLDIVWIAIFSIVFLKGLL
ncbi:cytochrome c oxidase subunit 3 [Brevirhabdus sp.]|uniref:cytochrome c oxidase subunit 3 n=1 Tax=Brevirhabdus sp. TaxID=2004514 RepID=UPI004057F31E